MQSKFKHCMEKPRKILHKARDFFVKSMEASHGGLSEEKFREASAAVNNKIRNEEDLNYVMEKELERQKLENRSMKRSYASVELGEIGTIDEDKPCYFEDDMIYAGSRSRALGRNF
ncbi:hypothetical protein WN943_024215 [Citrus x changshan-huyou]